MMDTVTTITTSIYECYKLFICMYSSLLLCTYMQMHGDNMFISIGNICTLYYDVCEWDIAIHLAIFVL